ncbi:uncharacterized protein LOC116295605 [Actinia tenebrosa]|uniref:Uncharacterized protein LOC116295605 n=1 Tax=Actinia tenebrosa TaxID=6105 RepID=A0A6P8I361_ACTTE|nr:uncharacterized protein LOC116295605 [Actinia tenebrosa]
MAERSHRSTDRVDYKALNTLSTVDLDLSLKGKKKYSRGSKIYLVERLISRRKANKEELEYLVKWKDWPLWSCTWEPSCHLNDHLIRTYDNPVITRERIQHGAALFLEAVLTILKSNAVKVSYSAEIRLDHDIVRYVFRGKGKQAADGVCMLYDKYDFIRFDLPEYWYYYLHELGQGIAIDFPIKLKTVLSFVKKRYLISNGQLKLAPNSPIEKVIIFVNRRACGCNNI